MGLKVTNIGPVAKRLENLHKGVVGDKARTEMGKGAKKIRNLARLQAPFLDGNLEKAIKIETEYGGINGRKRFTVYVDESMAIPGRSGATIGDYAVRMHEGVYNLGKKSLQKQSAGVIVGRKYLERAADDLGDEIARQVVAAIKAAL